MMWHKTLMGLALAAGFAMPGPAVAAPLPTYTPAYEPTSVDERGIWMEADETERQLRDSNLVIRDAKLNEYVRQVFCQTVGDDRCRTVRIYVMRIPQFNATMYPNGMMTVWSGMLLRVRDEAELGAILGHEFGHFELRHSLNGFKARRTATDIMAWASLLAPSGVGTITTAAIGSFYSFSREQEKQADLLGHQYLVNSAYPSASAARVWERLMAEADATAAGRKRKSTQRYAAGFLASHPTHLERATYLRDVAAKAGDQGDAAEAAYRSRMEHWLPEFLADQIKLNDFGGTEYLLGELAGGNWTPELLYARAELYRQRGNPRDLVSAAQFYQDAIAKGFSRPEGHRGLGLALMRSQQTDHGRAALQHYLKLSPDASDAPMISALVAP